MDRKLWQLGYCLAVFLPTFLYVAYRLAHYPFDWTYTAGQAALNWYQTGLSPFGMSESWYALAFVIFTISSLQVMGYFVIQFLKYQPARLTLKNNVLENLYLVLIALSPLFLLSRSGTFLKFIANLGPEYQPSDVILTDPLHLFFPSLSNDIFGISNFITVAYAVSTFLIALHLQYIDFFGLIPKIVNKYQRLRSLLIRHQENNEFTKHAKVVLLMFCTVFFVAFFALHLITVTNPLFDWAYATSKFFIKTSLYFPDLYNMLEFWYALELLVYLSTSIGIFVIFFKLYSRQQHKISAKFLWIELALLGIISVSPFFGLHLARIITDVGPAVDPEYDRQMTYMTENKINSWYYHSIPLEERALAIQSYSVMMVSGYLILLGGFCVPYYVLKRMNKI